MTKDSIIRLLEKFGIEDFQSSGQNLRFPCPYRKFTHNDFGRGEGKRVFSLSLSSPHLGRCFVCEEVSTLSELTLFLALLQQEPELYTHAVSALELDDTKARRNLDSAYEEMEKRLFLTGKDEKDLGIMEDWFENLPSE